MVFLIILIASVLLFIPAGVLFADGWLSGDFFAVIFLLLVVSFWVGAIGTPISLYKRKKRKEAAKRAEKEEDPVTVSASQIGPRILLDGEHRMADERHPAVLFELSVITDKKPPRIFYCAGRFENLSPRLDGAWDRAIPASLYRTLSPDTLADWMERVLPEGSGSLIRWERVRANPQLKEWCGAIRQEALAGEAQRQKERGEDALVIWKGDPHRASRTGIPELLNLTLLMRDGVPTVAAVTVWDEGGHDGMGETADALPEEVCRTLSPETLTDRLRQRYPADAFNPVDWEAIRGSRELEEWCARHRVKDPFRLVLDGTHHDSYGDAELYDLSVTLGERGEPVLNWTVTWRGGVSHASGSGGKLVIPPDLLPVLTPEVFVEQMRPELGESIARLVDWDAVAQNPDFIAWCDSVRQTHAASEPPQSAASLLPICLGGAHTIPQNGTLLNDCSLVMENDKPAVRYSGISRDGGGQADGGGGTDFIPASLWMTITPHRLWDWMRTVCPGYVFSEDGCVMAGNVTANPQVSLWCRRMRAENSVDAYFGVVENPLELPESRELIFQMRIPAGYRLDDGGIKVHHNETAPFWRIELDRGQDPYPPYIAEFDSKQACLKALLRTLSERLSVDIAQGDRKKQYDLRIQFLRPLVSPEELLDDIKGCMTVLGELLGGTWFYNGAEFVRYD